MLGATDLKYYPTGEFIGILLCGLVYHQFDKCCKENEKDEISLKEEMSVINLIIKSTN